MYNRMIALVGTDSHRLSHLLTRINMRDPNVFHEMPEEGDYILVNIFMRRMLFTDMAHLGGELKKLDRMSPLIRQSFLMFNQISSEFDVIMQRVDPSYQGHLLEDFFTYLIQEKGVPASRFQTLSYEVFNECLDECLNKPQSRLTSFFTSNSSKERIADLKRNSHLHEGEPVFRHDVERVLGFRLVDKGAQRLTQQEITLINQLENLFNAGPNHVFKNNR